MHVNHFIRLIVSQSISPPPATAATAVTVATAATRLIVRERWWGGGGMNLRFEESESRPLSCLSASFLSMRVRVRAWLRVRVRGCERERVSR